MLRPAIDIWADRGLTGFAVLLIVLMLAISIQVLCSMLDINPLAVFDAPYLLIGKAITLNSLLDFQWHLLAVIALLPAGLVWCRDGHVRVDFLYAQWTDRQKAGIELIGHVVLTSPFLFLCVPASWSFMFSAWRSDQGSTNDGLNDLWLIKATLPLGLALLCLVLVADIIKQARRF
ncbi:MAG: TRAP transporter small permease subunit [Pseudomonadota bacterium]